MIFQTLQDRQDETLPSGGGLPDHKRHIKLIPDVLDVVAVVSNPVRYRTRYDLFRAFERHVTDAGARLTVVECAFGNRPFEVTSPDNPRHVQLRSAHELWLKEAMINVGFSRLPRDSRYVAWIDADLTFSRPDWVQETIQQLQHHPIVQMYHESHDLGPNGSILTSFRSFAWSNIHGVPRRKVLAPVPNPMRPKTQGKPNPAVTSVSTIGPNGIKATATTSLEFDGYYGAGTPGTGNNTRICYWHHPGFAWAARKEALDTLGGLFDVAVVGEADYIMAKALVHEATDVLYPGVSPGYRKAVEDFQRRALRLRGDLGYVEGSVFHAFHGSKGKRMYWDRCKILTDTQFDPTTDLVRDHQGLYQLADDGTPRSLMLRDAIRKYFRNRDEDSNTI